MKLREHFQVNYAVYWANLGRFTNLLVILNVSFFFLTELVTTQGYYYTFYSLLALGLVYLGLLVPVGRLDRLWYYLIFLVCEIVAVYFVVVSVVFWVVTNRS